MEQEKMKVSKWLCEYTDSHAIQDAAGMAKLFKEKTGLDAPWHTHSVEQTARNIRSRGKGGSLNMQSKAPVVYGYDMAEACAEKWGKDFKSWQTGLGFRFQTALRALEAAGQ